MKVLITGSEGFIGKNLQLHLAERKDIEVLCFTRAHNTADLPKLLDNADFVFHLAGINRPKDPADFTAGNTDLTRKLCSAIKDTGKRIPVVYTSSIQASLNNPYGISKRDAEDALFELCEHSNNPVHVFRLPNVFGKWCKPNYNSAVATFCHNIARDIPIQVNDPNAELTLVYVDDVVARLLQLMDGANPAPNADGFDTVTPQYKTTVGQVVELVHTFRKSRNTLITAPVGTGLVRALYSTYVSHLPPELFSYTIPKYDDPRGVFVEMLKTPDSGQFSYFTAHPGITRGGHYHHSKTEKFLVIKGQASFKFRHMQTHETHELLTSGEHPEIVETVPGWTHDITNIGADEMIVMLWANEIFDRSKPDTFACPL
jgi:UDP-2-acetamido-2,6-beta-L-arabino-hexul-4-ose reductase